MGEQMSVAMDITTDGGMTTYTIHQSDLNTYLTCPERARQLWTGVAQDFTCAEAAVGTATHKGIELAVGGAGASEVIEGAVEAFRAESEAPGFRWVKLKTEKTAIAHIQNCLGSWARDIWPHVPDLIGIEVPFDLPFHTVTDWQGQPVAYIRLAGRIDAIDCFGDDWDWKTGGRLAKYTVDGWQLRRWGVQPTTYTWATQALGYSEAPKFHYAAMLRTGYQSAVMTVERDASHWSWLRHVCTNLAHVHMSDLGQWPVNDQHALCSADWCPAWSTCRGLHCDTEHVSHGQTVGILMDQAGGGQ